MASPASIKKHPIHPILITIPIGLWVFSFVSDVVYLVRPDLPVWRDVAYYTMAGGIVGALLAAIPGLVDLVSLKDPVVKKIGIWHMVLNLIVVGLFAVNFAMRTSATADSTTGIVLSAAALVFLSVAGWLGGEMVFVHGVAVEPTAREEDRKTPRRAA